MAKVLVIEDELAFQKVLKDTLTKEGYQIIQAFDGEEGLNVALKENPDVILLDILLPGMNGMEMLHKLRKDPRGKRMKVIVLTNLEPSSDLVDKSIKDQPTFYLIKSDTKLTELTSKIKQVI